MPSLLPWASDEALGQLAQQAVHTPGGLGGVLGGVLGGTAGLDLQSVALGKVVAQAAPQVPEQIKATAQTLGGLGDMGGLGQLGSGLKL